MLDDVTIPAVHSVTDADDVDDVVVTSFRRDSFDVVVFCERSNNTRHESCCVNVQNSTK